MCLEAGDAVNPPHSIPRAKCKEPANRTEADKPCPAGRCFDNYPVREEETEVRSHEISCPRPHGLVAKPRLKLVWVGEPWLPRPLSLLGRTWRAEPS